MAGDAIPTKRKNDSECPYPINESITSIEPPSYHSIINDETGQGPGCGANSYENCTSIGVKLTLCQYCTLCGSVTWLNRIYLLSNHKKTSNILAKLK